MSHKYCPFCGKELRSERARQCRHCHADWHSSETAIPDPWVTLPEQDLVRQRLFKANQLEEQARLSRFLIVKLGLTTGIAALVMLVTLVVTTFSLGRYGKSVLDGSQLIVLYSVLVIALLLYAGLTFRVLPSGILGLKYLTGHSLAILRAKSIKAQLRLKTTRALSPNAPGVTTRSH